MTSLNRPLRTVLSATALAAAALALSGCAQIIAANSVHEVGTTPAVPGVVTAGTPIEVIREDFKGTEGPLALANGSLIFTEGQLNRITRIDANGVVSTFLENTNGANALGFAGNGDLYAVQTAKPQVGIISPAGRAKVLADNFQGAPFGRPNDIAVTKDGTVYFTDSGANRPAGAPAPAVAAAKPAVYRITAKGELQRLDDGVQRPNGVVLSTDEKVLYVANTAGEYLLAYDIAADGKVGARRNFTRLAGFRQTENGPTSGADGLTIDALGRVYVATSVGIEVFDVAGKPEGIIPLPKAPQNLAFAGADKRTLYAVGRGAAYRIETLTPGFNGRAK